MDQDQRKNSESGDQFGSFGIPDSAAGMRIFESARLSRWTAEEATARLAPTHPHFQCVGTLGGGGQGVVYRAIDSRKASDAAFRNVAIKFPLTEAEPSDLKRFVKEPEILEVLDHPNIVKVLEGGRAQYTKCGLPFFVLWAHPGI